MKNSIVFNIICFSFLLLHGCKETVDVAIIGPDYFPLEEGKYIIYSVESIVHDAFKEQSDTSYYLEKETIQEDLGNDSYKLLVERSTDSGRKWLFVKYLSISKNTYTAQRNEDDIRKVKLSFPFKFRKTWDANELNTLDQQRARMLEFDTPHNFIDTTLTETVTINLGDDEDPFFTFYEREVYARHIGLVESKYKNLERQPEKYLSGTEHVKTFKETNW
ncbi:MAG: hypothetical protein ACPGTP_05110 [Bacteroidia bacterium]